MTGAHTDPRAAALAATAAEPDARAMDLAVRAALRGVRGATPLVGAVVTAPDGTVLAVGHHAGAGTPHAEIAALQALRRARAEDAALASIALAGCTLHVTLEPCDHHGRTGPCSQAVIDAGIGRCVYAVPDATGDQGGGAARLRAAGVRVEGPTGHAGAEELTRRWREVRDQGRPWVTAHLAQSLDGCAAAADGTSRWITSAPAREHSHRVRARADAIVVGTGTLLADDPRLTARRPDGTTAEHQPLPVIVGRRAIPAAAAVRTHPRGHLHVPVHEPEAVLAALAAHEGPWRTGRCEHVMLEGGPRVLAAWIEAGLIDEMHVYTAPLLLGAGLRALEGLDAPTLTAGHRFLPDESESGPVRALGPDVWTHLRPADTTPGDEPATSAASDTDASAPDPTPSAR